MNIITESLVSLYVMDVCVHICACVQGWGAYPHKHREVRGLHLLSAPIVPHLIFSESLSESGASHFS